jgi:hypothetical protein
MGVKLKGYLPPLKETAFIPMERETKKLLGEFFGRNIQNRPIENSGLESVIIIEEKNKIFEYHIDNIIIEEIKKILRVPQEQGVINLGRQTERMFLTIIVRAREQYQEKDGDRIAAKFRLVDIMKYWGVSDGAKTRQGIEDSLASLYATSYVKVNLIGSKPQNFKINRLIDAVEGEANENEEIVYEVVLAGGSIMRNTREWIKTGVIPPDMQKYGYLGVPITDLTEKNQDVNYLNLRERLRLIGSSDKRETVKTQVKGDTLLSGYFKFSPDKLRRPKLCREIITECLERAKFEKEIIGYRLHLPETLKWKKEWFIEITKLNQS